ncbi:MAG: tetratricopeptide repeat protein [Candidatus Gastranaerophilales bacterium]|nr:tetratricopeptide repeat protein [Candidatus Gastranaerophilales bacterium]
MNIGIIILVGIATIIVIFAGLLLYKKIHRFENLYGEGMKELEAKNYAKARDIFLEIAKKHPVCQESLHRLGIISFYLGDYEAAELYFAQAAKNRNGCHIDLYNTALSSQMKGELDIAKKLYEKTIEVQADDTDAIYNMGIIEYNQKSYNEALQHFLRVDKFDPDKPIVLYYIARCQEFLNVNNDQNLQQEITEMYEKIMDEKGLPKDFFVTVAYSFAKLGNVKKTLILLDKALAVEPENAKCYKLSALTDLVQLKRDNAKHNILIAVDLDPEDNEAKKLLDYINLLY